MEGNEAGETIVSTEVKDLTSARFLDPLPLEYEDIWSSLTFAIESTGETHEGHYIKLAVDESLPQVIRDRAFLAVEGTRDARQMLGITNWGWYNKGFKQLFEPNSLRDKPAYMPWLQEAFQYQYEHNIELISESKLLYKWTALYEDGGLGDDELNDLLSKINVQRAQPTDNPDGYPYDRDRFPLLSDVIQNNIFGGPKLKVWATEQLDRWFKHKRDGIAIPKWYEDVSEKSGLKLYNAFVAKANDPANDYSWDDLKPVIDFYGWLPFLGEYHYADHVTTLLQSIPEPDIATDLLRFVLDHTDQLRMYHEPMFFVDTKRLEAAEAVALRSGDESLIAQMAKERERYQNYREQRRLKYENYQNEEKEKRAVKERGEARQRDLAQKRFQRQFHQLLEKLREEGE